MARLTLTGPLEIATGTAAAGGKALFTVDPTDFPRVSLWERIVPFAPPGPVPPPPPFAEVGLFASTTPISKTVPLAALYQARLFREGEGNAAGEGPVLGKLDFPCVLSDSGRANFLTRCAEVPQLDIAAGGTFVTLAFAASKQTMARVQLAPADPLTATAGLPFFPQDDVAGVALSAGPKVLHKLTVTDPALLPGNKFMFTILVWDSSGNWDFLWSDTAAAPAATPVAIRTKKRVVDVRLTKLYFDDDTDQLSDGEGSYTLVVQQQAPPAAPKTKTLPVGNFETGTDLVVSPPTKIVLGPDTVGVATRTVSVQVRGFDDDSGSFPSDDDDRAETDMTPLDLPVGEGTENVIDRFLALKAHPSGGDDTLRFRAELFYSVNYQ